MATWLCGYVAMWLRGYVAKWFPLPLNIPTPTPPLHPSTTQHPLSILPFPEFSFAIPPQFRTESRGWESKCWGGSPCFRLINVRWFPSLPLLSAIWYLKIPLLENKKGFVVSKMIHVFRRAAALPFLRRRPTCRPLSNPMRMQGWESVWKGH